MFSFLVPKNTVSSLRFHQLTFHTLVQLCRAPMATGQLGELDLEPKGVLGPLSRFVRYGCMGCLVADSKLNKKNGQQINKLILYRK